jgi:hypothetical protein
LWTDLLHGVIRSFVGNGDRSQSLGGARRALLI